MKNGRFILLVLATLTLSGCSADEYFEKKILQKSGMYEDASYQGYVSYEQNGLLDENGYYMETDADEEEQPVYASVHVTVGSNSNLTIRYYSDALHLYPIDECDCYLEPGDSLYASVENKQNNGIYQFSEFRIYDYSEENTRTLSSTLQMAEADNGYVLTLPSDYSGSEIAIEAVGTFGQRTLNLAASYVDENDTTYDLSGPWIINDTEYTSGCVELNPRTPYIISFEYDSDKYFYESSSPECYYNSNADGMVIFNQLNYDDPYTDYTVKLRKYLSFTITSDTSRTVKIDDKVYPLNGNDELTLSQLKYGDTIKLETNKEWAALGNLKDLVLIGTSGTSSPGYSYSYTLSVPQKGGDFIFDPTEYKYEHGALTFRCFGDIVETPIVLAKGQKIYYEAARVDDDYWLNTGTGYITVGEKEETCQALRSIEFLPTVKTTVYLSQPKSGGKILYYIDGKSVPDQQISVDSGTKIDAKLEQWEGWFPAFSGKCTYIVSDNTQPQYFLYPDKLSVDDLFHEDTEHQPILSIILEKSIGNNMQFTFKASGIDTQATSYDDSWNVKDLFNTNAERKYNFLNSSQTILQEKIGTDKPLQISLGNSAIKTGKAVRITSVLKTEKEEYTQILYITDPGQTIDPLHIYDNKKIAHDERWFKTMDVTIGLVDIQKHSTLSAELHSKISVRTADTNIILQDGDCVEPSQKVVVSIIPDNGYYVSGKNITNNMFSKTVKYSEYLKNIDSMVSSHPIQKYYQITLGTPDSFASYEYELDGKSVTGKINAKEGQKLKITYTITDENYTLSKSYGGFFGIGTSNNTAEVEITISSSLDGKTITQKDFNIETKRGG